MLRRSTISKRQYAATIATMVRAFFMRGISQHALGSNELETGVQGKVPGKQTNRRKSLAELCPTRAGARVNRENSLKLPGTVCILGALRLRREARLRSG